MSFSQGGIFDVGAWEEIRSIFRHDLFHYHFFQFLVSAEQSLVDYLKDPARGLPLPIAKAIAIWPEIRQGCGKLFDWRSFITKTVSISQVLGEDGSSCFRPDSYLLKQLDALLKEIEQSSEPLSHWVALDRVQAVHSLCRRLDQALANPFSRTTCLKRP